MKPAEFGLPAHSPRAKTSGGYLFPPRRLARGAFLKWLRRTHAWIGLWGAALGCLFGTTGILLNYREMMKIPAARMEQNTVQLPLPEPRPADPEALALWLGEALQFASGKAKIMREPGKTVIWNGVAVQQPARWQVAVRTPQRFMQAEYWEGNAFVTVKRSEFLRPACQSAPRRGLGRTLARLGILVCWQAL